MVKALKLTNIRCFEEANFKFSPDVNLIIGQNGSGKTTILESIGFFAFGRYLGTRDDFSVVTTHEKLGRVETIREFEGREIEAEVALTENDKVIKINKNIVAASKIIGFIPAVYFNPETINLISGSPQIRRRELDLIISQKKPVYVKNLLHFRHILRQRNNLLRRIKSRQARQIELDFWDKEFVKYSKLIYKERLALISKLNQNVSKTYQALTGLKNSLEVKYEPSLDYERIEESLVNCFESDLLVGLTSIGPHRDDIVFFKDEYSLKERGSRGEQRLAAISYKLEAKSYLSDKNIEPILILDDVFSELDSKRRELIAHILQSGQIFISSTDKKFISDQILEKAKVIDLNHKHNDQSKQD